MPWRLNQQRPHEEAGDRLALFVGQDFDVGKPGRVVDRDMDELPPGALRGRGGDRR
jgi:hypothetical protein